MALWLIIPKIIMLIPIYRSIFGLIMSYILYIAIVTFPFTTLVHIKHMKYVPLKLKTFLILFREQSQFSLLSQIFLSSLNKLTSINCFFCSMQMNKDHSKSRTIHALGAFSKTGVAHILKKFCDKCKPTRVDQI